MLRAKEKSPSLWSHLITACGSGHAPKILENRKRLWGGVCKMAQKSPPARPLCQDLSLLQHPLDWIESIWTANCTERELTAGLPSPKSLLCGKSSPLCFGRTTNLSFQMGTPEFGQPPWWSPSAWDNLTSFLSIRCQSWTTDDWNGWCGRKDWNGTLTAWGRPG